MTEEKLGLRTRLKEAIDFLNSGGNPWIVAGTNIYWLSGLGNPSGMMIYTKYRLVDGEALYSVRHPFSYNDTVRSILDNGDNLGKHNESKYRNINEDPDWERWSDTF